MVTSPGWLRARHAVKPSCRNPHRHRCSICRGRARRPRSRSSSSPPRVRQSRRLRYPRRGPRQRGAPGDRHVAVAVRRRTSTTAGSVLPHRSSPGQSMAAATMRRGALPISRMTRIDPVMRPPYRAWRRERYRWPMRSCSPSACVRAASPPGARGHRGPRRSPEPSARTAGPVGGGGLDLDLPEARRLEHTSGQGSTGRPAIRPSGPYPRLGRGGARIHASCAVVAAPTLDRVGVRSLAHPLGGHASPAPAAVVCAREATRREDCT